MPLAQRIHERFDGLYENNDKFDFEQFYQLAINIQKGWNYEITKREIAKVNFIASKFI